VTARRFAEGTDVTVDKSRMELERLVTRHGATGFVYGWDDGIWTIAWRMQGRHIRFRVVSPSASSMEYSPGGRWRPVRERKKAVEAEIRRRWRALLLIVKAKLELIASGDADLETEFLAQMLLPNGSTVGEWIAPQLDQAYESGEMPPLVPGARAALGPGRTG
jgi:hypothetical protein